ncbi:riboflavin synthase subunit beta [Aequorivita sp. SDUM287046]|uniref:Riboflavin synthase subunit beta n=1 Tax=Aequorivita aurantiaca TaxID=3053356 RepID=A0ABT8DKZ4_9FLAO|nr:riboflavin synthase subunit beta [Aequorivita aurantiaca]MDN3723815.1 riboflavin synthase subunit beta [Aequorivita aurantiaca]
MGLISKRKNKKYSYKPRHYEFDGDGSPFAMGHKFDQFRTTVGENKGLKGKFKTAMADLKKSDKNANLRLLVIIALLVLVFLFIIGFDLSIFYA